MDHISFKSFQKNEFIKELEINKIKNGSPFLLNNELAKNFKFFLIYLYKNKIKKITLINNKEIDIILLRNIYKIIKENFNEIYENLEIYFENFSIKEIQNLFCIEHYFIYFKKSNYEPEIPQKFMLKQFKRAKNEKNKLEKYEIFNNIFNYYIKNKKYCYFDFPKEKENNRFVFYIYIYSIKIKKEIIKLFQENNVNKNIIDELKKLNLNYKNYAYAFGFSFNKKTNNLSRTTFYYGNLFQVSFNKLKFFKEKMKKFNLKKIKNINNIDIFAIDYYNNYKEYKLYSETLFNITISDKKLNKILNKKPTINVYKIKNNEIITIKYEFELEYFSKKETELVKKILPIKNSQTFSIYLNSKNEISKLKSYWE